VNILAELRPTNCSAHTAQKVDAVFLRIVPHRREQPTSPTRRLVTPSSLILISGRAASTATPTSVMAAPSAAVVTVLVLLVAGASGARLPARGGAVRAPLPRGGAPAAAVFALGSFWRSEAAFGCLPGVIRTSVGYAGGSKTNPEYRNLADHAECVKVKTPPVQVAYGPLLLPPTRRSSE
jgi:hypothetical protein